MRTIEDPVRTPVTGPGHDAGEYIESHPAYAMIGIYHRSGGGHLFGSDFKHQNSVAIKICKADLRRGHANDWYFGGREIIEVVLSEAQYASMVGHPNSGSGVPCTLSHVNGQEVPGLPAPKRRTDQFASDATQTLQNAANALAALREQIGGSGLSSKKQAALLSTLEQARMNIGCNLTFVADQFDAHMEKVVVAAKTEINAHAMNTIHRLGMEAIAQGAALPAANPPVLTYGCGE
ncbi:hypothetical protein [Nevskia ramosa]|uniref:hypothetical protein n=1 Tax=Nevskia ramosa TaxID=64002 RepID=UPI003D0BB729